MVVKLKTKLSIEEVSTKLNNKLVKDWKSHWNENVFTGEISNNRFRYFYRKAYTKNSFSKEIIGVVYEQDGDTLIKAKITTRLLNLRLFVYIWIIIAFIFLWGVTNKMLSMIYYTGIVEILVTMFFIIPIVLMAIMPSKKASEQLIMFLKDNIAAEEIDD
ncbi:hypothetical protein SH1V18_19780 [Vallitalea longa]|uniref:Uncharacterized protein n=1 Tax=Vallitalea longa TaxID=2936439 RepID=A0A9W5YBV6_9FIRM|nr:hypothetical protein [Vallitalea longa]GKX29498.1 hypothetical protein SH1V18_19780 [Vallitalea longa]